LSNTKTKKIVKKNNLLSKKHSQASVQRTMKTNMKDTTEASTEANMETTTARKCGKELCSHSSCSSWDTCTTSELTSLLLKLGKPREKRWEKRSRRTGGVDAETGRKRANGRKRSVAQTKTPMTLNLFNPLLPRCNETYLIRSLKNLENLSKK
jgi:hypothetical protein